MATSRDPHTERRRLSDRPRTDPAIPPGTGGPTPEYENTPGHPNARGTSPMACHPTEPAAGAAPAPAGVSAADRAVMRARLAAMAAPRDNDTPTLAALRAVLRDEALMARVVTNVERWPPLTDEQRETLGALMNRSAHPSRRRAA